MRPSRSSAAFIAPEVLNSHAIFAPRCGKIIYSSNEDGPLRPFVVEMENPRQPKVAEVEIAGPRSFIAESLAPDCHTLAMVSDHGGDHVFEVFLYDLDRQLLRKVSSPTADDQGKPVFAPNGTLLAYLSDEHLALFDYVRSQPVSVPATSQRFQSVVWAGDGASVFMEDERFDIWQYDIAAARLREIWASPEMNYLPRAISEDRGHLLFTSSHETPFRQIYRLTPGGGSPSRIYPTDRDQFSPVALGQDKYTFRSDLDASFVAYKLDHGQSQAISPTLGVTYDFTLGFGRPLLLYSDDQHPIGFFWFEDGKLTPLLSAEASTHQTSAIPIRNSSGMVNFLYLPPHPPRALVVWLHGGPHEQVSPRYNLYFDFLLRHDFAVYAINYPGSTGIGAAYAMPDIPQSEAIPRQVQAIQDDIDQLDRVRPVKGPRVAVGVSYGSVLARRVVAADPKFVKLIDFSGIADPQNASEAPATVPSALFIYGENDKYQKDPARIALLDRYAHSTATTKLLLPDEGHFIAKRDSVDLILKAIGEYLQSSDHKGAPQAEPASHTRGKGRDSSS